jgi:monoamine oxidase
MQAADGESSRASSPRRKRAGSRSAPSSSSKVVRASIAETMVGAAIGGLTAGALLARAGKSVLVVEADERPGAYARALQYEGYTFDRADRLTTSCEPEARSGRA